MKSSSSPSNKLKSLKTLLQDQKSMKEIRITQKCISDSLMVEVWTFNFWQKKNSWKCEQIVPSSNTFGFTNYKSWKCIVSLSYFNFNQEFLISEFFTPNHKKSENCHSRSSRIFSSWPITDLNPVRGNLSLLPYFQTFLPLTRYQLSQ